MLFRSRSYRIAIKQIHAENITRFLIAGKPDHIVVLVRNPLHVGMSLDRGQWKPVELHMRKAIETARYVIPVACHTAMVYTISGLVLHRLRRMARVGDVPAEAARVIAWRAQLTTNPIFFKFPPRSRSRRRPP